MDASLKDTEYDVILVGTGMVESILAGALARIGKKILHLDQNNYYGSNYASFTFSQFRQWLHTSPVSIHPTSLSIPSDDVILPLESSFQCHLLDEQFSLELDVSSSFSIDISPRLVLASSQLVDLLITSGVGRYLEFAAIERSYVRLPNQQLIDQVPCSKRDIFQSQLLNRMEKRQLMKFLQFVADYGETEIQNQDVKTTNERLLTRGRALIRPQNKASQVQFNPEFESSFHELLTTQFHLSSTLELVVLYCVGLASSSQETLTARQGLAAVYRYVASIGRFASTAFLAPLYGVSELAQSFCRLSAVYGGLYVLQASINAFVLDPTSRKLRGVRCSDGDILRAKNVVVNASYADNLGLNELVNDRRQLLRGVFVLKTSLRDTIGRFVLVLPPQFKELTYAIHVIQLDSDACVCPKGYFLVQITTLFPKEWEKETEKALNLINTVIQQLLEAEQNSVNWSNLIVYQAIFTIPDIGSNNIDKNNLPINAWVSESGRQEELELSLESACANARAIFEALCPTEPFLPKSASAEQAEQEELDTEQEAVLRAAQKLAQVDSKQN